MDDQLAALRDFTGACVSDAKLRSFLVRAAGDVDRAASLVLSEGALKPGAPKAVSRTAKGPPPSALPTVRKQAVEQAPPPPPPQVDAVRRTAWTTFYKLNYTKAITKLGLAPEVPDGTIRVSGDKRVRARITSCVTDMWTALGPEGRNELYAVAKDSMIQGSHQRPDPSVGTQVQKLDAPASARVDEPRATRLGEQAVSAGTPEPEVTNPSSPHRRPRSPLKEIEVSPSKLGRGEDDNFGIARTSPEVCTGVETDGTDLNVCPDDEMAQVSDVVEVAESEEGADEVGAGTVSVVPTTPGGVDNSAGEVCVVDCDNGRSLMAASWPKQIGSRMIEGTIVMSMTKGKRPLRAGMALDLVAAEGVVRFCASGREFGMLPSKFAGALAPALMSGFVEASGRVIEAPKVLKMFCEIILEVNMHLSKKAFEPDKEAGSLLAKPNVSLKKTKQKLGKKGAVKKGRGKNLRGSLDDNDGMDVGRLAVANLLSTLDLCCPAAQAVNVDRDEGSSDPDQGQPSGGAEVYYRSVQKIDAALPEYEHPSQLLCELREYQKHGVAWMRARELYGSSREGATDAMLHPMWKRKEFMDGCPFFVNGATGSLSLKPRLATSEGPFGGILADEMGLGKTVECITVMVLDRAELDSRLGYVKEDEMQGYSTVGKSVSVPDGRMQANSERMGAAGPGPVVDICDAAPEGESTESDVEPSVDTASEEAEVAGSVVADEEHESCGRKRKMRASSPHANSEIVPTASRDGPEDSAEGCQDSESGNSSGQERDDWEPSEQGDSDDDSDFEPVKRRRISRKPVRVGRKSESSDESEADLSWVRKPTLKVKSSKYYKLHVIRRRERKGESSKQPGGTLLVVPMSMMSQWVGELQKHVEPGFFRVVTHHERRCTPRELSVQEVDVVITTYGVVASETSEDEDEDGGLRGDGALFSIAWRRIILDEAHSIKGRVTKIAKACFLLTAKLRWCVTGSPIQNHVSDVQPLLRFIGVQPWSSWGFWQRGIVVKLEASDAKLKAEALSTIRDILSPLTLRRLKSTLGSDGKPLVNLVARTEEVVKLSPGPAEKDFYETLHTKSRAKFDTFLAQGKVLNKWGSVLELLLRLRQACCHPWLVFAASQADAALMNDRKKMYELFAENGSKSFAEKVLSEAEGSSAPCPICLCTIEDAAAVRKCGHAACRACLMRMLEASGKSAACPICRVPVSGKEDIVTLPRHGGSRFPMDIKANWQSSVKLDAILADVKAMEAARNSSPTGEVGKMVVMSQFTSFLDLVGTMFEREGVISLRFDGTLPAKRRAAVLQAFSEEDESHPKTANVMLVSLRSGSVGLNLCSASLLLLMDPSWNPAQDAQAAARVHRHGQTRPVTIKRYVVENSVEERLLEVQDRKLDMTEGALSVATDDDKKDRVERMKLLFSR